VEEIDLSDARRRAVEVAADWGVELADQFELSKISFVAPAGDDAVIKVLWEHDDEGLHEPDALELWDGDGAVRLLRRDPARQALLEERIHPGTDLSHVEDDDEATEIAVAIAQRLWRPAGAPFRRVADQIPRWLANEPTELTPFALELFESLEPRHDWLTHGDFHHHNILLREDRYVAIDPKPYLGEREFDVYTWLHNPIKYLINRADAERRIAHFVAAGLDDYRIRAWAIIRGAHLNWSVEERAMLRSLLD
jgi:streptomycin 6-kinase